MLKHSPQALWFPSLAVAGHSMAFYAVCSLLVLSLLFRGIASADAVTLYGTFIFAAYISPFFGSWTADRLGLRATVVLGGVVAALGVLGLSVCGSASALNAVSSTSDADHVWYDLFSGIAGVAGVKFSLAALAVGVGLIKPNLVTIVTRLFPSSSPLVDPALARYYSFTNGGAIVGPLLAGAVALRWGYSWGFAVALVGELFLLAVLAAGWTRLQFVESSSSLAAVTAMYGAGGGASSEEDVVPRGAVAIALRVLIPFFLVATVGFWPAYHQNYAGLTLWAQQHTQLDVWGFHIPPAWFGVINSVMCVFLSVPLSQCVSGARYSRDGQVLPESTLSRNILPMGYAFMSLSFIVLLIVGSMGVGGAEHSPLWLVVSIALSTLSELAVSIGGLSRVAKLTPRRYVPLAMSTWYATVALGGLLAGQLGRLPLLSVFAACSALSALAGVSCIALDVFRVWSARRAALRPPSVGVIAAAC